MSSDQSTETAMAVDMKLGKLEETGKRLMVCQELNLFFKGLEKEGVGTGSLESKARKMVEERNSKNLGGESKPVKKVTFKTNKTGRNNYNEIVREVDKDKNTNKGATNRVKGGGGPMTEGSRTTPTENEREEGEETIPKPFSLK